MAPPGSRRISAIVLDLDGTLVDSAAELAQALNTAFGPLGRRVLGTDEVRAMIGDGVIVLTRRALAATGEMPDAAGFDAALAAVRHAYDRLPVSAPYDGVIETLSRLKAEGFALAVCTNKPEGPARRLMSQLGLDVVIDALAGGDSFSVKKPHPGHVTGLLERLGCAAECAVMVGDSLNDALAARGAGLPFVAVTYGYCHGGIEELEADALVDAFADLPDVIAQLSERR
jgi:phosphoglycolate phosphatase